MRRKLILLAVFPFFAGCASLPRYTAATPHLASQSAAAVSTSVAVLLEPVFPGKSLPETVVDNAIGAYWSPEEASQIGFTQNYGETLATRAPQLALLASLPPSIRPGFAASGQAGGFNISSRIMVPIGLFITSNTKQLLESTHQKALVCVDLACMEQARGTGSYDLYVVVRVKKLRVAEEQANTFTLEAEAQAEVSDARGATTSQLIRATVKNRSITSEGFFHRDFLKVMNKIANEVSSDFALQLVAASRGASQETPPK